MKTVIYHSADYDGIFCREIAKHFLGEKDVNYIGWNFGDALIPIPQEGGVYILDLSPECLQPEWQTAPKAQNRLVWIDHHKSSIEKWMPQIPGYRIDGVAACRLAWQWFAAHIINEAGLPSKQMFIDRKVQEPLAVRLAGEYDVWDHRGDGDLEFQFGLDSWSNLRWDWLLSVRPSDPDPNGYTSRIIESGKGSMQCYAKRDGDVIRERSYLIEWEGLKFLTLNTARCNSNTFAAKDDSKTGHDALLAFYFNGKCWTVSLYHAKHRTDLDLSLIAVKHGGGGHRGACGFTCKTLPFMQ